MEERVELSLSLADPDFQWSLALDRGGVQEHAGSHGAFAKRLRRATSDRVSEAPVFAVYRAGRAWGDALPVGELPPDRLHGYRHALDAGRDLADLRAWWQNMDHRRLTGEALPVFDAVARAVARLGGEAASLPLYDPKLANDILIDLPHLGGRFAMRELSDGYRGLIGLVADVARRAAQLNPQPAADVLREVTGVVVIDELDLHLHPKLQGEALPLLRATFPKLQFIVTTHSPLVLGSVADNDEVVKLGVDHSAERGQLVEGRSPERIITDVMGAKARPAAMEAALQALYRAIDKRRFAEAGSLLAELSRKWGSLDPDVVHAQTTLDWER